MSVSRSHDYLYTLVCSLISVIRCILGFAKRDDRRYLKYSFMHVRTSDSDTADRIFDTKGIQFSPLHKIPGLMPAASAPPDFMHGLYLGSDSLLFHARVHELRIVTYHTLAIQRHTLNQIIIVGGMLTKRSSTHDPF